MNKKFVTTMLLIVMVALSSCSDLTIETENSFPLVQKWAFHVNDSIYSVAVSDQGIAITKPGEMVLVDINSGSKIWGIPFPSESASEIYFSGEFLIAQSPLQIYIFDKTGAEIRHIDLMLGIGETAHIFTVMSNYIFVVRKPAWKLEVYNVDDATLAWSANVGCIILCKSASESYGNRPPILKQIGQ